MPTWPLFQHPENEKFQFFLYTVPAEMLYLQKYLTNYQKIFVAERWGRLLLWMRISSSQIFCFCNSNVTTFQHPENVKISIFPFTLSQQKFYIFKSIHVTTFPKSRKCKNFNFSIFPLLYQPKFYICKSI